jgi:hypothetical protein
LNLDIVLQDPDNFEVTNIWSGPIELGVPGNLGGMLFSPDGNLLYIVGESETRFSTVYGVPVVRDPVTNKVINLLPTTGVIYVGDPLTAGLDAGFEFGPEGTIFNTYWSANKIGQRPGGPQGSETLFDMLQVGIPSSIAGLTFSPHVTDPATRFGQMLVSSWSGANLFEVPLTPLGGGLFRPEQSTLFVTLPLEGTGAIQFVPSGLLAGNLMYVNWDLGMVRVLTIDPGTGLPIDQGTGQPKLGTTNPMDDLFASGFGVGPWGLEFDPLTNDFFVSTWSGTPVNSVIHISGLGFATPPELIARLNIEVQALNDDGVLSDGIAQSLLQKLQNALSAVLVDRPSADNMLNAFINEILALMPPPDPGTLTPEQGQVLIDLAQQAIDLLN